MSALRTGLTVAGVAATYAGLVGWLTWPLVAHLATHLPDTWIGCRTDAPLVAWALARETCALAGPPCPLVGAGIFHPTPHSLFYGETAFGALPWFLPPFLLTGNPTLALNVTFLAGVTLTATALHLVCRRWTASHLAGLVAAWTFLTTHWVLWAWVPSAPNYATLLWLPPIILLAATPAPSLRRALVLLPLLVLQGLVSVYVAAATFAPLVALALGRTVRRATRGAGLRLLAVLALAMLPLLGAWAGHVIVRGENPAWALATGPPRLGPPRTSLPWGPLTPPAPTGVAPAAFALIALGALLRVVWRRPDGPPRALWLHGALWTGVGLAISVTPGATWAGTPVRLPWASLAAALPLWDVLRAPTRLGVAGLMGLALLAGAGLAECQRRLPSRLGGLVAAIALLAIHLSYVRGLTPGTLRPAGPLPARYPLRRPITPNPSLDPILARETGPLLELPVGAGPIPHARAMYRAIFHGRPILNGYSGYTPAAFRGRMALACALPDPEALAALRRETGLATILVDLPALGSGPRARGAYRCPDQPPRTGPEAARQSRRRWQAIAEGGRADLRLLARDGPRLLFAVVAPGQS